MVLHDKLWRLERAFSLIRSGYICELQLQEVWF